MSYKSEWISFNVITSSLSIFFVTNDLPTLLLIVGLCIYMKNSKIQNQETCQPYYYYDMMYVQYLNNLTM